MNEADEMTLGAYLTEEEESSQEPETIEEYETGLPPFLQHDLDAYKEVLRTNSKYLDCLWGELYGSINAAQGMITPEHADYLRKKYLFE